MTAVNKFIDRGIPYKSKIVRFCVLPWLLSEAEAHGEMSEGQQGAYYQRMKL